MINNYLRSFEFLSPLKTQSGGDVHDVQNLLYVILNQKWLWKF
jgi:hypothetical protein